MKKMSFFSKKSLILSLSLFVIPTLISKSNLTKTIKNTVLANTLKKFKVSNGVVGSFCFDPNGAFFVDNQDPKIRIHYKNETGETKSRLYQASIDSIGLNVALSLNCNLVFFTGDMNFLNTDKTLYLGKGVSSSVIGNTLKYFLSPKLINKFFARTGTLGSVVADLMIPNIDLLYVPFINAPGAMIILSFQVGSSANAISLVTGGTLTPIDFN